MLKLLATQMIDIIGDGRTDTMRFSLRQMQTPAPIASGVLPTAVGNAKLTGSGGGTVRAQLDGEMLTLTFDIPPSSGKISIDFLYGHDD